MTDVEKKVLVVDDEPSLRDVLAEIIRGAGFEADTAANGSEALEKLIAAKHDYVLCDIRMPVMDGLTFLKEVQSKKLPCTVVMMSAFGDVDTAVESMKLGAYDYISKPLRPDEVILTLRKAEERRRLHHENQRLKGELSGQYTLFHNIVAKSEPMMRIFATLKKVAAHKSTVLLLGESGTGKELIARAIHYNSPRAQNIFVPINCGAIPETLLETELFGHIKGAFTDASRNKRGLFEEADQGTIFLDEIGELSLPLQVKLLRVLQEEEIRRVGDTKGVKIDVRVLAATSRDLQEEVKNGRFREDLYYRLNVVPIRIPPLRERREDLPLLEEHFIQKFNAKLSKLVRRFSEEARKKIYAYDWPGNVREFENMVERAMVLTEGETIPAENLPETLCTVKPATSLAVEGDDLSIKRMTRRIEETLIRKALVRTKGNRTRAAELLEISHRALLYKIKEFGVVDEKL